jgi:hypothetical protein
MIKVASLISILDEMGNIDSLSELEAAEGSGSAG